MGSTMRYSLRTLLILVVIMAIIAGMFASWPRTNAITSHVGLPYRSKATRCLACPNTPLYTGSPDAKVVFLPLYGDESMSTAEIISKGFDGPIETLVFVRWQEIGPVWLESIDVKTGERVATSLATAIDSLKAFDQHSFDLPRKLQRNHGERRNEDAMVDVRCHSGPQFRAWYVNDWGHFYITRFEADRPVVNQYERMQKKGQGKTAM